MSKSTKSNSTLESISMFDTIEEEVAYFESLFLDKLALEGYKPDPAPSLEAQGWQKWLLTLFPFIFSESFSADHEKFWELRWDILQRYKQQQKVWKQFPNPEERVKHFKKVGIYVSPQESTVLTFIGRGLGKSALLETARIMYGAILGGGYSLMISETDDQAQEHLGNCKILIEHPDSRLLDYYPDMAIAGNAEALVGMPTTDRKEMFICKNGYILRAKGLHAKMRGLRVGNQRPTEIALDDIDDVSDSLMVSQNKLRLITSSILPVLAKDRLIIDFGQNLISEHSIANQLYTGRMDALADRTIIGVTNAFNYLDIESYTDATGKMRHKILPTSVPSWEGLNIDAAQRFLNNSGLSAFMAEYQNEFDRFKSGRVIPEYNEEAQIITWSQFQEKFGQSRIPQHWNCIAGHDVGYSEGTHPHFAAWNFIATSAMNSGLPGKYFVYRSRTFTGTSIDDQAEVIKASLFPNENILSWQMSHERTGEMLTLNQKYGLPFQKFVHYKAEDGVPQWRHLSRCDHSIPNPFNDDELLEDGTWRIGCPSLFYIVDDDQKTVPRDDKGMKLLREQVSTWDYVPVKLTEQGLTKQKPSKVNDDHCDVLKSLLCFWAAESVPLTFEETVHKHIPEQYRPEVMAQEEYRPERELSAVFAKMEAVKRAKAEMPGMTVYEELDI